MSSPSFAGSTGLAPDTGSDLHLDILRVLGDAQRDSSRSELRTRLRARGWRLTDYELAAVLRQLRAGGEVGCSRGRWHAIGASPPIVNGSSRLEPAPDVSRPTPDSRVAAWSPRDSWLFADILAAPKSESVEPSAQRAEHGPWATFRALLDYYTDCVRNDEGCEASANLTDLGRRLVSINSVGAWYPQVARPWHIRLPATAVVQGLIRSLAQAADSGVLVLGYPLWIYADSRADGDRTPFLKPVFTYLLEYELQADGLHAWSEEPLADVNLDWLSYALKQSEQQRAFLAAVGLMDRRGTEDERGDGSGQVQRPDFRTLATAVTTFFGDRVCEPLNPEAPTQLRADSSPRTGIHNHAVLMVANRTRYARSLLKDLARIRNCSDSELDATALRTVFRMTEVDPDSLQDSPGSPHQGDSGEHLESAVIETCELNSEQRNAVASMMATDLTLVTGPPGTGKSQVVTAAIANCRLADQTVLFASRNHKAIDAVVLRPEMRTEEDLSLIARANDRDGALSFTFSDAIQEILASPHEEGAEERLTHLKESAAELIDRCTSLNKRALQSLELSDGLAAIEETLSELSSNWSTPQISQIDAAPHFFPTALVGRFNATLSRVVPPDESPQLPSSWLSRFRYRLAIRTLRRLRRKLSKRFPAWSDQIPCEPGMGFDTACRLSSELSAASRYCDERLKQRPLEEHALELTPWGDLAPEIEAASQRLQAIAPQVMSADAAARSGLPNDSDRSGLASLRVTLRRHSDALVAGETRRDAHRALVESIPRLLWHFPAWAVTNLSINSRIPLIPGMFDLAIIDEAGQCDIASAIPIMFRAKRAAVVGDPRQLAHTTKLTRSRDNVICKRHGIVTLREQRFSYPDTSLFDLFSQTNGVTPVLLRDHYRCAGEIADYANRTFYGSRLRVVTAKERLRVPAGFKAGIHWTEAVSTFEPRRTGCVAPLEVDRCTELLRRLLLDDAFGGTVGVVTPFREQKRALEDAIFGDSRLAHAAARASVVIDTAHGFQGDERDVMLMSLCAGPGMPPASLAWLRKTGNLLNVAVTRARALLHVVGNRQWAADCGIPHLASLARPPAAPDPAPGRLEDRFESPWERRLYDQLVARGFDPIPQYPLLGRRLDLALMERGKIPIDIEIDGARFHREPDGSRRRDDIWRDITIRGAGWKVMRFWVYELRDEMDACIERVSREWNRDE